MAYQLSSIQRYLTVMLLSVKLGSSTVRISMLKLVLMPSIILEQLLTISLDNTTNILKSIHKGQSI